MKSLLLSVLFLFGSYGLVAQSPEFPALEPGIRYTVKTAGTGPTARSGQIIAYALKCRLADGTVAYEIKNGAYVVGGAAPKSLPKGLASVLSRMKVGEIATVGLSPEMGFGDKGYSRVVPPNAELTNEVEILSFNSYWLNAVLWEQYNKRGIKAAENKYIEVKKNGFKDFFAAEGSINYAGIGLIFQFGRFDDGLKFLQWNTELHPASANTWDSVAEAYFMLGNLSEAVEYTERATKLDPKFSSAMVKWLRSNPQTLTDNDRLDMWLKRTGFFKGEPFESAGPTFPPLQELLDKVLKDPKQASDQKAKLVETFLARVNQFGKGDTTAIWDRYLKSQDPVVRDSAVATKEKFQQTRK